ncbi:MULTISPECIES: hypothetical protein [Streptomyces]|uniref:Uncharacterized protein n=1 Tax=Streptomyces evansiae TaxID=3075535 RepID=A0ABU2R317_9ACTN|nr:MULTISPECIES: hypothetical protein [unclassified Streptomyces]MDT0411096.1 hypothetical protein [Streptomyces sp. DSM 41979]MYQ56606.1 hypothetical protein [Streptomyces sp. SID4926]SCD62469.1 hypothetical protein GA0115252_111631 [Streptomyces sp. DfronAA-171]
MALEFVGIDPETTGGGSPTVWVEKETADLVLQGEEADVLLKALVGGTEWVAGHDTGIPPHERLFRIPARMVPLLRKACDVAERRAGLR